MRFGIPNGLHGKFRGVLTVLADKTSIIYSDEFNHSSIIDGCRLSGATIRIFRHNNVNDLQRLIDTDKKLKLKF